MKSTLVRSAGLILLLHFALTQAFNHAAADDDWDHNDHNDHLSLSRLSRHPPRTRRGWSMMRLGRGLQMLRLGKRGLALPLPSHHHPPTPLSSSSSSSAPSSSIVAHTAPPTSPEKTRELLALLMDVERRRDDLRRLSGYPAASAAELRLPWYVREEVDEEAFLQELNNLLQEEEEEEEEAETRPYYSAVLHASRLKRSADDTSFKNPRASTSAAAEAVAKVGSSDQSKRAAFPNPRQGVSDWSVSGLRVRRAAQSREVSSRTESTSSESR